MRNDHKRHTPAAIAKIGIERFFHRRIDFYPIAETGQRRSSKTSVVIAFPQAHFRLRRNGKQRKGRQAAMLAQQKHPLRIETIGNPEQHPHFVSGNDMRRFPPNPFRHCQHFAALGIERSISIIRATLPQHTQHKAKGKRRMDAKALAPVIARPRGEISFKLRQSGYMSSFLPYFASVATKATTSPR